MLEAYIPALVFIVLGLGVGVAFTLANARLGPRRPNRAKAEPYESGVRSDFRIGRRFAVSYYLVGMLFVIFDIEVILLYPAAVAMERRVYAAVAIVVFILFLAVAFVYEWRRGVLDFHDHSEPRDPA